MSAPVVVGPTWRLPPCASPVSSGRTNAFSPAGSRWAHGYVRATHDVDFITRPSLVGPGRGSKAGIETRLLRGAVLEGGFSCLKGEFDGMPFDVLPQLVPFPGSGAAGRQRRGLAPGVDLDGLLQLKSGPGGRRTSSTPPSW